MNAPLIQSYCLSTPAQWAGGGQSGVVTGADGHLQPYLGFGPARKVFAVAGGCFAAAVAGDETAWWRGADGALYRLDLDAAEPVRFDGSYRLARARQLAADRRTIWAAGHPAARLHCHALDDLGELFGVDLAAQPARSMATDGHGGLWLLAVDGRHIARCDCAGGVIQQFALPAGPPQMRAIASLSMSKCLALLTRDGGAVWFLDVEGAPVVKPAHLNIAELETAAVGSCIGSDGGGHLFIGITSGPQRHGVLAVDAAGDLLERIDLDAAPASIGARGSVLLVAGSAGTAVYRRGGATAASACILITPRLSSPRTADAGGWLRAELSANLPRGALVSIEYAAQDDADVLDDAERIARNPALTPARRLAELSRVLQPWSRAVEYTGSQADGAAPLQLSAPLFNAGAAGMWLRITMKSAAGGAAPVLRQLRVHYPERSLMQHLPAIYRKDDAPQFMRALVGVLETTTQQLDRRIATLGSLLHPQTADEAWLDATARWLGLPWNDALALEQKRRLLRDGHRILALRGTRAGLAALLAALTGSQPGRFRILDANVDLAAARLGGAALPAVLSGLPASASVLGRKAILGRARLTDADAPGASVAPPQQVRVELNASLVERRQWESWLPAMLEAMVPVTVRVRVRWRVEAPAGLALTLGDQLVLNGTPTASLGADAVLGAARLPARHATRLTEDGADAAFRLQ